MDNEKIAMRVSLLSIISNALLSFLKLIASIIGHSGAMLSDAVHSFSDILSTIVVIIGVKIANKDIDDDHPYGHEKFECVASLILAMMLFVTALGIGYSGIINILHFNNIKMPGKIALIAAIISIVVKEGMYQITKKYAKTIKSDALMADAWHHRSDSLSSIGSLLGIGAARCGYPVFDSIASIVICLFIVKAAYDIFKSSIDKMVDKASSIETIDDIRAIILSNENVLGIDSLKTRQFGNKIYVDIELALDAELSFVKAHQISEQIHHKLEKKIPEIKHCTVHANPSSK